METIVEVTIITVDTTTTDTVIEMEAAMITTEITVTNRDIPMQGPCRLIEKRHFCFSKFL